jgi:hypothetical protein
MNTTRHSGGLWDRLHPNTPRPGREPSPPPAAPDTRPTWVRLAQEKRLPVKELAA